MVHCEKERNMMQSGIGGTFFTPVNCSSWQCLDIDGTELENRNSHSRQIQETLQLLQGHVNVGRGRGPSFSVPQSLATPKPAPFSVLPSNS